MPLNAEQELSFGRLDGFDDAVRCFANDRQPPGMIKCLDVMTMDASSESSSRDVMNRSIAMLVCRLKTIRKMLVQSAACVEPEHLHSEADSQHRHLGIRAFECVEEFKFEGLSHRIDEIGTGVDRCAESGGVRIVAAAENDAVQVGQHGRARTRKWEEWNRNSAALGDRSGVSASEAGLILHKVGGDTDEWEMMGFGCDGENLKPEHGTGLRTAKPGMACDF